MWDAGCFFGCFLGFYFNPWRVILFLNAATEKVKKWRKDFYQKKVALDFVSCADSNNSALTDKDMGDENYDNNTKKLAAVLFRLGRQDEK